MPYLYETADEQGLFLYEHHSEIVLRRKNGHQMLAPIVVAKDYGSGLQDTIYNSAIYYTYINAQGTLMVRSVLAYVFPFERPAEENITYRQPRLVSFYGRLLLFFVEQDSRKQDRCCIRGILPCEGGREFFWQELKEASGEYGLVELEERLLLCIKENENQEMDAGAGLYWLYPDLHRTPVREPVIDQKLGELADCRREIARLKETIAQRDRAIQYYKSQIQSATEQYQELMKVAQQYRDEVNRWNNWRPGR